MEGGKIALASPRGMEGGKIALASPSSMKLIPDEFPAGLRVLVVDDDPICLKIIEKMLTTCKYKVTTCTEPVVALSFLNDSKERFDLVLSDVYMPDMNGFELLANIGLKMDLPVIMMSADDKMEVVMQGVIHGACDYFIKPVRMENIKNIWQHVLRKKRQEFKDLDHSASADDVKKVVDDGDFASSEASWKFSKRKKDVKDEEDEGEDREDSSSLKKPRVVWSVDLHQQFVSAVNQLGIDKAVPKKILELMNVQGLTRENVASHLQKYRLYLRRINMENQSGVSDSFGGPSESNYSSVTSLEDLDLQALASSAHLPQHNFACSQSDVGIVAVPNNIGIAFAGHVNVFNSNQALMSSANLKFGNPQLINNQLGLHQVIPSSLETKQLPQLHQAISTPFGSVNFRSRGGLSGLPNLPSQIMKQFPVVESTMPGPTRITGQFANEFGFSPSIGGQMLSCNVSDPGKQGPILNGRGLPCGSYMPVHGADFLINNGQILPTSNFLTTNGGRLSGIPSTKVMDLRNEDYHKDTTLLPYYDAFNGQNIAAGGAQNSSLPVSDDIEAGLHALEEPTKSEQTGAANVVQGNSQAKSNISAETPSVVKVEPSSDKRHGTMQFTEQPFAVVPFHALFGQQESGDTDDEEFDFDAFALDNISA